ncbi:MAG: carboxyl transferase domain-containing protein [Myxococcota bacterium]|nr:carboxyl transferase domain-containing protein [Myxococcota bacterium]
MGRVNGRPCLAGVEDFSTLGGSIGQGGTAQRYRMAELAMQERVPLVMMLEGAGHRLTDTGGGGRAPNDLLAMADLGGHVPMVCLVLGASAGHGALAAPLSDFVVMSEQAAMFTGGPPLVKSATGEEVTKQELGGPQVCAEIAGSVHNVAPDDSAAIEMARDYLAYFPLSRDGSPPRRDGPDSGPRRVEELLSIIPPSDRTPYQMRKVIDRVVDEDSFFEIQPRYGQSLIVGMAFLGGRAVAIVANDPSHRAGAVDSAAAIKAMDFLETVGHFHHPVIFLADNPGVMAGTRAEREGILKWGGKMFRAERRIRAPKLHVTMRKAFGFGMVTMAGTPFDHQTLSFALPGVNLAAMPASSGGRAAKLSDEQQRAAEEAQTAGPYRMATGMGVDDVIDPRDLRNALLGGLLLAEGRDTERS